MPVPQFLTWAQSLINMPTYATRIPESVRNNISTLGYYIKSSDFDSSAVASFLSNMITKIGKQLVTGFKFGGADFGTFYKGEVPYGGFIEHDYIGPTAGEAYPPTLTDGSSIDPFVVKKPTMTIELFAVNYGMQYWTTLSDEQISTAVLSNEAFANIINESIGVTAESYKMDKYLAVREMFGAGDIYGQTIDTAVNATAEYLTAAEAESIIAAIRTAAEAIQWSQTQYNKAAVINNIPKDDTVLLINGIVFEMIRSAMKQVYHNDIDFGVNEIIKVDGFGTTGATAGMYAALVSRRGVKLYDKEVMHGNNIFNPRGEYWNHFLKGRGFIGYSYVTPAVKFTLSAAAGA